MKDKITCPQCGKDADCYEQAKCLCDKDFCLGQRCGASDIYEYYKCKHCGAQGTTPEYKAYMDAH